MSGTYGERPSLQLRGWLKRFDLDYAQLSAVQADVLAARHQPRHRSRWIIRVAALAVAAAVLAAGLSDSGKPSDAGSWLLFAALVIVTLAILARNEIVRRADRRIGSLLPYRVTRTRRVSPWQVLGRSASAGLLLGAVTVPTMILVALLHRPGPVAWAFAATCVAIALFVIVGLRRALSRPVIAVDDATLTVDDLLRSAEACWACLPLAFAACVFGAVERPHGAVWEFVLVQVLPTVMVGLLAPPARRPRTRRHWTDGVPYVRRANPRDRPA